jgi:hypothetical protein
MLQKCIAEGNACYNLDSIKRLQSHYCKNEYYKGKKGWVEFPGNKDVENWVTLTDPGSTKLIAIGLLCKNGEYSIITSRIDYEKKFRDNTTPKNQQEFAKKHFKELTDLFSVENRGYIESLCKIKEYVQRNGKDLDEKLKVIQMIDDMKECLKNER